MNVCVVVIGSYNNIDNNGSNMASFDSFYSETISFYTKLGSEINLKYTVNGNIDENLAANLCQF